MRKPHTKRFWSNVHGVYKHKTARKNRAAGRQYTRGWNEILDLTPPSDARRSHIPDMIWELS